MRKKYISIQFLNTGAKLLATRGPNLSKFLLTIHRILENCTIRLFDDQSKIIFLQVCQFLAV